jgi:hypothetical protein
MTAMDHAGRLWTYMSSMRSREAADAVVVCCSYDLRVCDYACELIKKNFASRLVLTGKTGNWTRHLWNVPEAHIFRDRALANGVEPKAIFLEENATNFGENIAFVRNLLPELRRVIFVTKPCAVLRVALTVPVQWPGICRRAAIRVSRGRIECNRRIRHHSRNGGRHTPRHRVSIARLSAAASTSTANIGIMACVDCGRVRSTSVA